MLTCALPYLHALQDFSSSTRPDRLVFSSGITPGVNYDSTLQTAVRRGTTGAALRYALINLAGAEVRGAGARPGRGVGVWEGHGRGCSTVAVATQR